MNLLSLREKHEYEEEIARLTSELADTKELLRKARNSKNEWHWKYRKIAGKVLTKIDRARILINKSKEDGFTGSVKKECLRISEIVKLHEDKVRLAWYKG